MCDHDHDGVVDGIDQCPNTTLGDPVNHVGCSDTQLTSTLQPFPPFGLTWTPTGDLGRAGGLTWTYVGIERSDLFHIDWVVCDDPATPCGLSLDGAIDVAAEDWSFSAATSDLPNGKLAFINSTHIALADGTNPAIAGRLTVDHRRRGDAAGADRVRDGGVVERAAAEWPVRRRDQGHRIHGHRARRGSGSDEPRVGAVPGLLRCRANAADRQQRDDLVRCLVLREVKSRCANDSARTRSTRSWAPAGSRRSTSRGSRAIKNPVALKRLYPHIATVRELVGSFIDEARLARYLRHPGIARVYEFGRLRGIYFIAFEFVPGPTLLQLQKHCIEFVGRMPIAVVLEIAYQLCDALDHAHNLRNELGLPLGIVHRDVSPSNVIVSDAGPGQADRLRAREDQAVDRAEPGRRDQGQAQLRRAGVSLGQARCALRPVGARRA